MKYLKTFESPEFGNILGKTRMADYNSIPKPEDITEIEEDMMSDEEVKQEVLDTIRDMKSRVNEWSVRDTLKHFTSYGFWNDSEMASIDMDIAREIATELYNYVEEFRAGDPNIEEVYDDLYRH